MNELYGYLLIYLIICIGVIVGYALYSRFPLAMMGLCILMVPFSGLVDKSPRDYVSAIGALISVGAYIVAAEKAHICMRRS